MRATQLEEFPGTARFEVRRRLGAGGMGTVYEVYDRERGQRVALKTIRDADASLIYRFKKEFRSVAEFSHPNLVKLYELVVTEDQCFFTMEYIEGTDFIRYVCPAAAPSRGPSESRGPSAAHDSTRASGASDFSGSCASTSRGPEWPAGPPLEPLESTIAGSERATAHSLPSTASAFFGETTSFIESESANEPTLAVADDGARPRPMPGPDSGPGPDLDPGSGSGSNFSALSGLSARDWGGPAEAEDDDEEDELTQVVSGASGRASPGGSAEGPAPPQSPPLHEARLRAALRQLCEALRALHARGKLHRDIKPSNVLVTRRGRLVLLDFGLSTELDAGDGHQSTTHGRIVGTAHYMAPEQAGRDAPLAPSSDWYSVGVMLFRALTGHLPFQGSSFDVLLRKQTRDAPRPREINPEAPGDLDELCAQLLSRDPARRPDGAEVARRLAGANESASAGANAPVRAGEDASGSDVAPAAGPSFSSPPSTLESGAPGRGGHFVGRDRELAALRGSFAEVERGAALAVFVHGRSGVGKSTLLRQFLDDLIERGEAVVLGGRCYEQESVAYKAIDTLIDSLTRFLRRLRRYEADGLMPRDVSALARIFPVLRRVDAVADAPRRAVEIQGPHELRRRAFGALRELLGRIGDRKPLVLAIDDLQWGDVDSAGLARELLAPPDPPRMLLVCAYRSEHVDHSECLRELLAPAAPGLPALERREVALDALAAEDSSALALALLGRDDEAARAQARLIAREAGGSPYFIGELAEHLIHGGELEGGPRDLGAVSLDEVLWRRVARLPAAQRDLVEALAVAARPVAQADATRVAGAGPDGFAALAALRGERLVRGTGAGALADVETYHDRIRETVVNHLAPERRKHWHERLAIELEAAGRADAETLAIHYDAADRPEKAARHYVQAARQAAEALAFERASALFRRALAIALERERGPADGRERAAADRETAAALRRELADALASAGRSLEAAEQYQRVCEGASGPALQEARRALAFQLLMSGRIDQGLDVYRDVLAHLGLSMPATPRQALRGLLVSRLALRLRGLGFRERAAAEIAPRALERVDTARAVALGMTVVDWIRGSSFQSRSLLLALRAGEPSRVALSLGWEVVPSACGGRPARRRTERLIALAEALSKRLDDPHAIGMARLARGAAEFLSSRFRAGTAVSDEATAIVRERCPSAVWELDTSQIFAAWCLFYSGDVNELRRRCPQMAREARERGDRYLETTVNQFPSVVVRLADDVPDEARARALEPIARWSQRGFHVQHLTSFFGQMLIDLYEGDGAGAWRRWHQARRDLEASLLLKIQHVNIDYLQYNGRVALAAARRAQSSVEAEPLLAQARRAARALERQRLPWSSALAALVRAGIAQTRGDATRAVELLRAAVAGLDAVELEMYAAAARRQLGRLVGGDEGAALVSRAETWMAGQGVKSIDKMARAFVSGFDE